VTAGFLALLAWARWERALVAAGFVIGEPIELGGGT
jgi:hypothetical protein